MTLKFQQSETVTDLIAKGHVPMLPFEYIELEEKLQQMREEQRERGRQLGEAMRQSSETDHDNAPADVINREAHGRVTEAKKVMRMLSQAVILRRRPEADTDKIASIGNLVLFQLEGRTAAFPYLLTGVSRRLPEEAQVVLPEDTMAATIQSPLGEALFGSQAGDRISYSTPGPSGRGQTATGLVMSITQVPAIFDIQASALQERAA